MQVRSLLWAPMKMDVNAARRARIWADHQRAVIARWKRRRGCVDCGYKAHSDALELDHRPGEIKSRTVASLMYASWEVIKCELAKCDIRCCNCHAIKTFERKRNSRLLVELADTLVLETSPQG
jgi:hypothetical protein